jgi:hypothetical protein
MGNEGSRDPNAARNSEGTAPNPRGCRRNRAQGEQERSFLGGSGSMEMAASREMEWNGMEWRRSRAFESKRKEACKTEAKAKQRH